MSYTRVLVLEVPSSIPWTGMMKLFRTTTEPELKAYKKRKIVGNWSFVQIGDHAALIIAEFDSKAKMNQWHKGMLAVRQGIQADTGMQSWILSGPVKASG